MYIVQYICRHIFIDSLPGILRITVGIWLGFGREYTHCNLNEREGMLQIYVALRKEEKMWGFEDLGPKAFGKGFLKLVTSQGHALVDLTQPLQAAGLREGST